VILHPPGLKGSFLAIVRKHEKPSMFGAMDHALGNHVYVRDRLSLHWSSRLPIRAQPYPAYCPAADTRGQIAGSLGLLLNGMEQNKWTGFATAETPRHRSKM
jgi:hypothetical protein